MSCLLYSKGCYLKLVQSEVVAEYCQQVAEYLQLPLQTAEEFADLLFNINAQAYMDSAPEGVDTETEINRMRRETGLRYDFDQFDDPGSITQVFEFVDRVVYQASSLMVKSKVAAGTKMLTGVTVQNIIWNMRHAVATQAVRELRELKGVDL